MPRLSIPVQNPLDYALDPENNQITLGLLTTDGHAVNLVMVPEVLAALISTGIEVRAVAIAQGAPAHQALTLKEFGTWEVGANAHKDAVILVLDRATPLQQAFRVGTKAARAIGRALIGQARTAEAARAETTRQ